MTNILAEYLTNIWYIGDWAPNRYNTYNRYMKRFEKKLSHWYPLGEDKFRIDHGGNYFNFFRRMGEPFYYALFDGRCVVGTVCYIYRKIGSEYVMYMCDLKIDPKFRNSGIMMKLLYRTIPSCLLRTFKFYAISMNESEKQNKILNMGQHLGQRNGINIVTGGNLNIYSLSYKDMMFVHELIVLYKKTKFCKGSVNVRYISLKNIKDLIIKKKNNVTHTMKLLHMHYLDNDNADQSIDGKYYNKPIKKHTHMFCTHSNSKLAKDLATFSINPTSTATIIHYNMNNYNWEMIQTCDI